MTNGLKTPTGKLQWHLIFPFINALKEVVKVMEHGKKKYAENNWMENVKENPVYYDDAACRHITNYIQGEKIDKDSGQSALAHAVCCLLIKMWWEEKANP